MIILKQCFVSILIIFLCVSVARSTPDESSRENQGNQSVFSLKTIVIDPGHGGSDPGNVTRRKTLEKNVNLSICLKFAKLLRSQTEYEVFLTRTTDRWISLADRANLANQFPANQTFFISIHCNSHPNPNIHGLESYIFNLRPTDQLAARLAKRENAEENINPINFIVKNLHQRGRERYSWEATRIVQSVISSQLKSRNRNRNARDKHVRRAPFRVLADTNMPATLVELGYLTHQEEHRKLTSSAYQDRVANSLLASIRQFDQVTQQLAKKANSPIESVKRLE
ncbi:MAG: N-acetylmuramoyl-L-alanine amidase [Candidatus Poribacteria bacterium]